MLFWACFIITFDMYDLVVYGSVLPVLMKQWSLGPVEAGAIGSYGTFGMMVGAILFGILADRFGRKTVLTASVILFCSHRPSADLRLDRWSSRSSAPWPAWGSAASFPASSPC